MRYNLKVQYIIDGHNLIPHIHGLSLSDPEDESKLLELLNRFQRVRHASITVFFDRAPIGMQGVRRYGSVRAVFVPTGKTADTAIVEALARNKSAARSITLVSSDRQVQAAGRERRATVISSSQFSKNLDEALAELPSISNNDLAVSTREIDEWLKLFSKPGDSD